jgi:hypothetical protein
MQNTRLSNLLGFVAINTRVLFANPWRRLAVWLIALLLGNGLGSVVTVIAGQAAQWDIGAAIMILVGTETVNWLNYRRPQFWQRRRSNGGESIAGEIANLGNFGLDLLNGFKVGLVYSLFVEAFKLGS